MLIKMWNFLGISLLIITLQVSLTTSQQRHAEVDLELAKFLGEVNHRLADLYNAEVLARWQNEIKGPNDLVALLQSDIATQNIVRYLQSISSRVAKFKRLHVGDEYLIRQLALVPDVGYDVLLRDELELLYAASMNMSDNYRNIKLCVYNDRRRCDLSLIPDVQNILHTSKSVPEIEYYWLEWRRKTGVSARRDFATFIELYRKTAELNGMWLNADIDGNGFAITLEPTPGFSEFLHRVLSGFIKPSDYWYKDLEENATETAHLLQKLMHDLAPLFQQFHGFVRGTMRRHYGSRLLPFSKAYPQNLAEIFIGNAYREATKEWSMNLPYPTIGLPNITAGLLGRGLDNPQRLFWNIADYFRSLGMPQIEADFWLRYSQPQADTAEEQQTCWHKAWNYYGPNEVKISYCRNIDEQRFFNMFEALSDVYYFRAYQQQPTLLQEEPFPNFSDALGKFFALAAASAKFLEKLKVVEPGYEGKEARINRLYREGLRIVFLLPIFYVLDRYRVEVLDGKIDIGDNCAYWRLVESFTGAVPPVVRTNEDFDAPAKLLMQVDDQYTSQIMSTVLQYQLYKHFCLESGQYRRNDQALPLDLCDLANQRKIGPKIIHAMSFGAAKSYKDILQLLTGENELKMDGLREYFQPLYEWLVAQNRNNNYEIGWLDSNKCTP